MVASGTITHFGSVFVNGVEYDTAGATKRKDDADVTGSDDAAVFSIGMRVRITGTRTAATGAASTVVYDDDGEGPVANLDTVPPGLLRADADTLEFEVLGTIVRATRSGTVFDDSVPGFGFDSIANDDVVEVSGLFDGTGVLHATFVEKKGVSVFGTTEVEIKGPIANLNFVSNTFKISSITVVFDQTGTQFDNLPAGAASLMNGLFVEVKGTLQNASTIDATSGRIEAEDDVFELDENEAHLEGLVSELDPVGTDRVFRVAGQEVDASNPTQVEPANLLSFLKDGDRVQVEGPIVAGALLVREIKLRNDRAEIHAPVSAISSPCTSAGCTVTLDPFAPGTIDVLINAQTWVRDESSGGSSTFTIEDLSIGNFVEIRAQSQGGALVATELRLEDPDDEIVLGPTTNVTLCGAGLLEVLGVSYSLNNTDTTFEDENEDTIANLAAFCAQVAVGELVKVKDKQSADGIADEAEREN